MNNENDLKEGDNKKDVIVNQDIYRNKQGFLVKCPMYCRSNCASKHHPLLVALLNCKDCEDVADTNKRIQELKHVVMRYEDTGKWQKDDPIPDSNDGYRYPMIHWAAALGMVNALKWLINHGMSTQTLAEKFGNETCLQKSLLCLQETCPNECYDKFEQIVGTMDNSLLEIDNFGSTVAHTCAEYMANDIPKFQYFQHCLFSIIFHLRSKDKETQLHQLMEMRNSEGNTVLHILCRNEKCGLLVRAILREVMPINQVITVMRNARDQRPVDIAKMWGCPRIYRFLTKVNYAKYAELDSDEDDLKIYPPPGASGKPIHPMNAVYDRKGNLIGEKLPPVAKSLHMVYDKKGNVIGEKLDTIIETDNMDDSESFWDKYVRDNDTDEPALKKMKLSEDDGKDIKKKESCYTEWLKNVKKKYPASHRGFCGHFMPIFDKHLFCLTCREKNRGDDPCIRGNECSACVTLEEKEKESMSSMYGVIIPPINDKIRIKEITSDASTSKGAEASTSNVKDTNASTASKETRTGTSTPNLEENNASTTWKEKESESSASNDSSQTSLPSTSKCSSHSDPHSSLNITPQSSSHTTTQISSQTLSQSSTETKHDSKDAKCKPNPTQTKTPEDFISLLKQAVTGEAPWKPAMFSYASIPENDFETIKVLMSQCGPELKEEIAFNLEQDHVSLRRKMAVVNTTEEELSNKYEDLQDGQMKLVIEVQKLLHKVNRLRREEKNLMDAIHLINGEINTTHTTHHGLKERLLHCKAALNVLHEIYDGHDSNDSDN